MICSFHCQQDLGYPCVTSCCAFVLRGVKNKSLILILSPLKTLIMDQVSAIRRLGLSAVCVTDKRVRHKFYSY